MTAIALFDALASVEKPISPGGNADAPVAQLAARLVESSLADWRRVRQYEADFAIADLDDLPRVLEVDRSIYSLHEQWIAEAEQIYARARQVSAETPVPGIDELADAIGLTRARLMATPEKHIHALEQVKRGEFIPAKELRDELNARLRARR